MRTALKNLCPVLILTTICLAPCAQAVPFSGTGNWACFQGTLVYRCHGDGQEAALTIELTNATSPSIGGAITGFFLNNPDGKISTAMMPDSIFVLIGGPAFRNAIDASPAGYYDIGVSLGGACDGAGDRSAGIAPGQTKTFHFALSGAGLDSLDEDSFVEEIPQGGDHFLAVRFGGLTGGESETVPADQVSDSETVLSPVAGSSVPENYEIFPNYPNPFNASTHIEFQLPSGGHVSLIIYDVLGRTARHLVDAHPPAGSYCARWNGRDDRGCMLKSGVYFCVFEAGPHSETIKMVLSR